MSIGGDLLGLVRRIDARWPLPAVSALELPPAVSDPAMDAEFGLVTLADGSAGLFFALLGDTLHRLHEQVRRCGARGRPPLALAEAIESPDPAERAVALGTISAVTRHVFRRGGLELTPARSALGGLDFAAGDHVGMVGLFPSLARRLRAQGIALTVIELRADKVQKSEGFEVTLDPARLAACNTILITASTLINGSLDCVLPRCAHARRVAVLGPSASCFPDPLFARGIHVVGGACVLDAPALVQRLRRGEAWGETVLRYTLDAAGYPGVDALLERL